MSGQLSFPGVDITKTRQQRILLQETAVPVFAGFMEQGVAGQLYSVSSMDEYWQVGAGSESSAYRFFSACDVGSASILHYAVQHFFDNGGGRCFVLCLGRWSELPALIENGGLPNRFTDNGLWASAKQETDITLIVLPDVVLLPETSPQPTIWQGIWNFLLVFAREISAHALLDGPSRADLVLACLESYAPSAPECGSLYWPHVMSEYTRGQETGRLYTNQGRPEPVILPASAAVAAIIGQVDITEGIWCAPANYPLRKVIKPEFDMREGSGLFSPNRVSINLIRSFHGRGVRIWGCRTLAAGQADSWQQYIQTRRCLLYIQHALTQMCHFSVYEPNTPLTWLKVKGLANSWLTELWQRGGLAGGEAAQAFTLSVGLGETMSDADVIAGVLIMEVGVALQQPAEFITLHLQFSMRQGWQERP